MTNEIRRINLPHEDDDTLEHIAQWLRWVANGIDNCNSESERVGTVLYRLYAKPTKEIHREMREIIHAGMLNANDVENTFESLALGATDNLIGEATE